MVSASLVCVAVLAGLTGVALSMVSSCCGSPDPPDQTPVLVGLVAALALGGAGVGLWSGGLSRWQVLGAAAVVPIVCLGASFSSVDFQALLPVTVLAWLWLWWFLRRGRPARWVASG